LKVGRRGTGLHPRWGAFTALEGSKRWRDRLLGSRSARRCGTPLPFGLKLGGDLFGCGLLRHRTFGGGPLGGGAFGCGLLRHPALGGGSLRRGALACRDLCGRALRGGGAFGRCSLGGALRRGALSERALRFGTALRGSTFGAGALLRSAFRGSLLRGGAKLFLRASLLGRAPLLDRPLHRGALLDRTSLFFRAPLRRHATVFLNALRVRDTTLLGCAFFLKPPLCRGLLSRGPFGGGAFGCGSLIDRSLLFVSPSLLRRDPLLDRALHRGVLGRGALLFFGATLLREPSFFGGALGRGAVLGGVPLFDLARFGRGSTFGCGSLCRGALLGGARFRGLTLDGRTLRCRALFRSATLFVRAPRFRCTTVFGGALFSRAELGGDTLFFGATRLLGCAPFFRDALLFRGVHLGDLTRFFDESRFFCESLFFGALLRRTALFLDASRLGRRTFLFFDPSRFRSDALRLGRTFRFCRALRGDSFLLGTLCLGGFVDSGEDLFVFERREDLVIFDLTCVHGGGFVVLERLLRDRLRCGDRLVRSDRLVDRGPRLFDARRRRPRDGRRGALDRCGRRAAVLVDELFEQTAEGLRCRDAHIGRTRIGGDRPTEGSDGAATLLGDVVLQLVVIFAEPLDLLEEHPTFFAGLLEDL